MSHADLKQTHTTEEVQLNRRSFFQRGSLLAGLTAVASTFSLIPFTPAHAASISVKSERPHISNLESDDAYKYIQATMASSDYQRFKKQQKKIANKSSMPL